MNTSQPVWKYTANLGDVNPFESGALLYIDVTGVYSPELVYFDPSEANKRAVHRIPCERCTMLANDPASLSSNPFHAGKPEWFASKLEQVSESMGMQVEDLAKRLVSSNPVERATGYLALVGNFGPHEFDSYPVLLTNGEIKHNYRAAFKRSKV